MRIPRQAFFGLILFFIGCGTSSPPVATTNLTAWTITESSWEKSTEIQGEQLDRLTAIEDRLEDLFEEVQDEPNTEEVMASVEQILVSLEGEVPESLRDYLDGRFAEVLKLVAEKGCNCKQTMSASDTSNVCNCPDCRRRRMNSGRQVMKSMAGQGWHIEKWSASWCNSPGKPCWKWDRDEKPKVEASGLEVKTVDYDRYKNQANRLGIFSVPAFRIVRDGTACCPPHIGYLDAESLVNKVATCMGQTGVSKPTTAPSPSDLLKRAKAAEETARETREDLERTLKEYGIQADEETDEEIPAEDRTPEITKVIKNLITTRPEDVPEILREAVKNPTWISRDDTPPVQFIRNKAFPVGYNMARSGPVGSLNNMKPWKHPGGFHSVGDEIQVSNMFRIPGKVEVWKHEEQIPPNLQNVPASQHKYHSGRKEWRWRGRYPVGSLGAELINYQGKPNTLRIRFKVSDTGTADDWEGQEFELANKPPGFEAVDSCIQCHEDIGDHWNHKNQFEEGYSYARGLERFGFFNDCLFKRTTGKGVPAEWNPALKHLLTIKG